MNSSTRRTVAFVLSTIALTAQTPAYERVAPKDGGRGLDALFPDFVRRLDLKTDGAAHALDARLAEIDRETRLWETLRTYARQGRLVELADLKPSRLADGTSADVQTERDKTATARRRLAERIERSEAARAAAPQPPPKVKAGTAHGGAMLDVVFEAPPPPVLVAAASAASRPSVDPALLSKALYDAGDLSGALQAIAEIPVASQSPELKYRRARALEKLRRVAEARVAYAETAAADPEGFFGRQARWMLELAAKTDAASAPSSGAKTRTPEDRR